MVEYVTLPPDEGTVLVPSVGTQVRGSAASSKSLHLGRRAAVFSTQLSAAGVTASQALKPEGETRQVLFHDALDAKSQEETTRSEWCSHLAHRQWERCQCPEKGQGGPLRGHQFMMALEAKMKLQFGCSSMGCGPSIWGH